MLQQCFAQGSVSDTDILSRRSVSHTDAEGSFKGFLAGCFGASHTSECLSFTAIHPDVFENRLHSFRASHPVVLIF